MEGFALGKENLKLLVIGFAIIVVGFLLMTAEKVMIPMYSIRKFSASGE